LYGTNCDRTACGNPASRSRSIPFRRPRLSETFAPRPPRRHEGSLARLARACARHRRRTILAWLVAAAAVFVSTAAFGGTLVDEFSIPNSDAQRAADLLTDRFPARSGDAAQVVFAVTGTPDRPEVAAVRRALAAAAAVPDVTEVGDPFRGRSGDVSDDGRIAYVDVQFAQRAFEVPKSSVDRLKSAVRDAVEGTGVQAEFGGPVITASEPPETSTSELLGLLAAVVILLVMLGSLTAMGVPILLALLAVGLGLSLLTLAAAIWTFNTITPTLATMLGLGVSIDYALFVVTRFRQALHDGLAPEDAAAAAAATAGRAVVFAGLTVAISISSLAVIGLDFITKLGLGAAITVVVAVAAAVTLLPAVLSLLGPRIDRGRIRIFGERDDSYETRMRSGMARWAKRVTGRPLPVATIAVALLVALAVPVLGVRLGASDAGSNPPDTTTRKAYDLLVEGFGPGFNGPLIVAVGQPVGSGAASRLARELRRTEGIASVPDPVLNKRGDAAVVTAYPTASPQSEETADLVHLLRERVVPGALAGTGARAYVGGQTAAFEDIAARIGDRLPLFLIAVIGITLVLISMAFRSVVIALKAALTTLLSAFASFGVIVAVFQKGWGAELIGLDTTGPIESFLPVIVFAILFGLSMDYEVFLVSRIREEYVHGDTASGAIIHGVAAIGRVVVAAALIMGTVFLSFLLGDDRVIKEFGLGLGVAILVDAFVVRLVVVPTVLRMLGERAWWMPRWLDRALPRLTVEPPTSEEVLGEHHAAELSPALDREQR
jgi:RND superfamily putative drug exporter